MLAASAEGWDVCPCLQFLQTQSGPEQLETLVFYVPLAPCCLLPARRVHWLPFLSLTNALINLKSLLLDCSNILFKIIIWKITWQRTLLLFLLWKGARFTKGLQAGLWLLITFLFSLQRRHVTLAQAQLYLEPLQQGHLTTFVLHLLIIAVVKNPMFPKGMAVLGGVCGCQSRWRRLDFPELSSAQLVTAHEWALHFGVKMQKKAHGLAQQFPLLRAR